MLVDRLSMRSPFFFHSFGPPTADLSCIYAGSSSGGAEDPHICCVVGGEDGRDGEEEKVMIVRKGTENTKRWLHSTRPRSDLRALTKRWTLLGYASLYSADLYKSTCGVEGVGTSDLSHHAQASSQRGIKPTKMKISIPTSQVGCTF